MSVYSWYPKLITERRTGEEKFQGDGAPQAMSTLSFWQWAASDIISNTMQGVLAEYIVASALGIAEGIVRDGNDLKHEVAGSGVVLFDDGYLWRLDTFGW